MDEGKLGELFRETARAAPPASFDEQDVIQGSRRVTARRRVAAAGGSLAVAAVLVGGVGFGTGAFGPQESATMSAPEQDRSRAETAAPRSEGPGILMEPSGSRCGPPDGQLAQALVTELPEAEGRAPTSASDCPDGSRSAAFLLAEGPSRGSITVILSPVGTVEREDAEQGRRSDGTYQATEKARSGRVLLVRSDPHDGSAPPFEQRLPSIAEGMASRF